MTPFRTGFAGLLGLGAGDPLSSQGYAFQAENPPVTDELLKIGAVLHRHDAHAAMVNPTLAATVSVAATGGALRSGETIFVQYTLTDGQGGESLPRAVQTVTTPTGYADPSGAPTAVVSTSAGSMLASTPMYALSVTNGLGGETALGPPISVTVPSAAHAEVVLSGFTAITNACSGSDAAAGWRLWRSVDGGNEWDLMATGPHGTNGFTDDGTSAGNCSVEPRSVGNTGNTGLLSVTVPGGQPASATLFSIYADLFGAFISPCLLGTYAIADAGSAKTFTALTVQAGAPPRVSRSYPGADKIDPSTDLLDLAITGTPTAGDVLTATSSVAASWSAGGGGGGGSGGARVLKFPITYDMAGLNTGVVIYTPTIGDVLLNAWIEVDTAWDGTTPLADIGTFPDSSPSGTVGWFNYIGGVIDMTREDHDISGSTDYDGLLVGLTVRSLLTASALAAVTGALTVSGTSIVYNYATSLGSSIVYPRLWVDLPAKFTTAAPIKVVVSQSGTAGSVGPGATQGAATVYLQIATPA